MAFSPAGWAAAGMLLLLTAITASLSLALDPVSALAGCAAVILAHNLGVLAGVVPRFFLTDEHRRA